MVASEEWLSGLFWGLAVGSLIPAVACRWWAADSHRRSMETYDRALALLSLCREFHEDAESESMPEKEPT